MRLASLILLLAALFSRTATASIELHAHLFMNEGMSWLFHGGFDDPLRANDWSDGLSSQANPETVEKSGLRILVATLYAHPLLVLSVRDSVRRQIAQANGFLASHPNWVLARSPEEARVALNQGKRVMILALEGAAGILEDETDFEEFIDRGGIRIVTPLHLTDDHFGGVAFLGGFRSIASPVAWFKSLLRPQYDGGVRVNSAGMTDAGKRLVERLVARRVWIDLAHASDEAHRWLVPFLRERNQPLLYTHTYLRRHLKAERAISDSQLADLAASGGVIGLMPSEDMLKGTEIPPELCPESCRPCIGSLRALATQYIEIAQVLRPEAIAMGSDFNGAVSHLKPEVCPTGTFLDAAQNDAGYWNIGQSGELWAALRALRAPTPDANDTIEFFMNAWARAAHAPQ